MGLSRRGSRVESSCSVHYLFSNSCIIPDMTLGDAFRTAVDSCSGIIFVVGNRTSAANARGPVFQKVKNVLDAAKREGKMYRFVYCTPGCGAVATV